MTCSRMVGIAVVVGSLAWFVGGGRAADRGEQPTGQVPSLAKLPRTWQVPHDAPSACVMRCISASNSGTVSPVSTFTVGVSTMAGPAGG